MKAAFKIALAAIAIAVPAAGYWASTQREPAADSPAHPKWQKPADFSHFRVGNRNVKAMLLDGNILWVGTSGGVVRYDTTTDKYQLLDHRSGLLANGVFHLSKLGGQLAVGTYGGGLSVMKPEGGWDTYNIPDGLADAFVYSVLQASDGDVWIATWSGANRVRKGALRDPASWDTFTVANTQGGLPNDWVYALAQGPDGAMWFATEGGLARYRDGKWSNWKHSDGVGAPYELVRNQITGMHDPGAASEHHARQKQEMGLQKVDVAYNPNYIVALTVAHDGTVWCGTWGGGLARFDGRSWKNFTVADGLPGNHVFALLEDSQRRLWIGTGSGVARYDGREFVRYTTANGLFANNVFSVVAGANGSLWIGSYGGVARIGGLL